eukprot:scaffold6849_cov70-Cyclotella_meneghiniana.AAC.1
MDIMNAATWLRLDSPDLRGLNGLTLEPQTGEDYLMASPLFYPIMCVSAPYQPNDSCKCISLLHYGYNE